jgi:hypothetical protein
LINILAQEKKELLTWLSSDDDHSSGWHGTIVERRAEDSGGWFLEKFEKWRKDTSNMCLLCTGKRTSIFVTTLTVCSWRWEIISNVSFSYCYLTIKGPMLSTTCAITQALVNQSTSISIANSRQN